MKNGAAKEVTRYIKKRLNGSCGLGLQDGASLTGATGYSTSLRSLRSGLISRRRRTSIRFLKMVHVDGDPLKRTLKVLMTWAF